MSRIALLLITVFTAGLASAQALPDGNDLRAVLLAQGYTGVDAVARDEDGIWRGRVRESDGRWREVRIDPRNGRVLSDVESPLDARRVQEHLESLGYRDVRDVRLEDDVWHAEVLDAAGLRSDLRLSPEDASVLAELPDLD